MKKFFVTNLFFLLTLNILIKSFWILGIDRGVQNTLPSGEYGIYYALLNFTYLFNIILDFGVTSFNNRTIAQNAVLLKKYFAKIIPLRFVLAGVYAVVLFVVAYLTSYDSYAFHLLKWLCVFQILTAFLTYLRSNISALMLFKTDSLLSVMDKTLTIIFCSVMLWTPFLKGGLKVDYFVYAQVLSMGLSVLTALIICLWKTGFVRINWDKKFMLAVLKAGFPYALLTLLMSFYNRMDTVMLERMLKDGKIASEIYASGFRLVDSVNMVAYLFSVILLPLFAKLIKDGGNVKEIIKISFHLLLLISVGFAAVSVTYSNELMALLYNKHIEESSQVFKILCFCFIPVSMTYIFGTLLTANGSLKKLNKVAAGGMIINIGINLLLIPGYAAQGSAYAALTAQTVTALLQILIAIKIFDIKISLKYCMKIAAFLLLCAILTAAVSKLELYWVYKLLITLGLFVVCAFVCRIFSAKELKAYALSVIKDKI
ncbi:MAG: polysaccharide biosynthesis C-terminal domain-containing protein [Bacteroidales bacterium]|nr:polysaccharide biosynthesis C-terminal domain-containing protein [Bacteroidales bacterium]